MSNTVKRGRPRKVMSIKTVKMNDLSFSKGLFKPMRTKTKVDEFFSSDKGVLTDEASKYNLDLVYSESKNDWTILHLVRN